MPKASKLIDIALVEKAKEALSMLGNNAIAAIRLKAIIASYKHGIKAVAEIYDINRSSLHRWVALFKEGQLDSIINQSKASRSKITQGQLSVMESWILTDHNITIKKLGIMIQNEWGMRLGKSTIHRALVKLGFSHITGRKKHYKSNETDQVEFKKKSTEQTSSRS